jgi:glutathione S-transferase
MTKLTLISHKLCPYVQRAVIALAEKGVPFERIDIDLASKPDWFLKISPLGKTPVLLVGDTAIWRTRKARRCIRPIRSSVQSTAPGLSSVRRS